MGGLTSPRERGRPARTNPGTASPIDSTAAAEAIPVSDVLATKQDISDLKAATKLDIARLEHPLTRLEVAVYGGGATVLALPIKQTFFS